MNIRSSGSALTRAAVVVSATALLAGGGLIPSGTAYAQFGPPMSVFGSISDSAGTIPEGVAVEAYVGNTLCGKGKTQFTGDGDGRVTVYLTNVVSREQTPNCGSSGADVRVKVGDRFAPGSVKWEAGPQRFDVTFGTATPAPIPTFTPTPRRTTPGATGTDAPNTPTPGRPAGADTTPPAGTPAVAPGSPTEASTSTSTSSATPTLRGGVTTGNTTGGSGGSGDDGFPVWAAVVAALGGIALVGGGVGFMMARSRKDEEDAEALTPPAPEL